MPNGIYLHKPLSEETKRKISESRKGKYNKGSFLPENIPWNKNKKGIHLSPKSEFKKGQTANEKHFNWKGIKVSYIGLHQWVYRKLGKATKCVYCGNEKKVQWANKSHKYKRELNDWIPLCQKCHIEYDKKTEWGILNQIFNMKENGKRICQN